MICPHCTGDARCKGFRPRTVLGLLGPFRLRRHYYHCAACRAGVAPLDQTLGLRTHDRSPAADEAACLAGVQDSFAAAVPLLKRLAGLLLSESSIERATQEAGTRIAAACAAGQTFGGPLHWDWHKDADGQTVAYVSIDATGIGQQGPKGRAADGRMTYVGMIYNPVPKERERWADPSVGRPDWQGCYVAAVQPLAELALPLRRLGAQAGMERAQRWVALSDGGVGLEDFLRQNFGRIDAVILDFWHAAEYLGKVARALYPGQDEAVKEWCAQWCGRLKAEGGQAVLEGLRELRQQQRRLGVRQTIEEVVGYFSNQVHRMDYPEYVKRGWQIGSGPVESACKSVIGQRMKGTGMRWGTGDGVARLRAVYRSGPGQWAAFWRGR